MKPAFTKKHYEKLAAFFAYELSIALAGQEHALTTTNGALICEAEARVNTTRGLARLLAMRLQEDNPKFDALKFLNIVLKG